MGKKLVNVIGLWLIVKGVLNLILSFSVGNVIGLIFGVAAMCMFNMKVPYINYIVAVILIVIVCKNLLYNISHGQILYLIEGVLDAVCVYMLCANRDVKEYLTK